MFCGCFCPFVELSGYVLEAEGTASQRAKWRGRGRNRSAKNESADKEQRGGDFYPKRWLTKGMRWNEPSHYRKPTRAGYPSLPTQKYSKSKSFYQKPNAKVTNSTSKMLCAGQAKTKAGEGKSKRFRAEAHMIAIQVCGWRPRGLLLPILHLASNHPSKASMTLTNDVASSHEKAISISGVSVLDLKQNQNTIICLGWKVDKFTYKPGTSTSWSNKSKWVRIRIGRTSFQFGPLEGLENRPIISHWWGVSPLNYTLLHTQPREVHSAALSSSTAETALWLPCHFVVVPGETCVGPARLDLRLRGL